MHRPLNFNASSTPVAAPSTRHLDATLASSLPIAAPLPFPLPTPSARPLPAAFAHPLAVAATLTPQPPCSAGIIVLQGPLQRQSSMEFSPWVSSH